MVEVEAVDTAVVLAAAMEAVFMEVDLAASTEVVSMEAGLVASAEGVSMEVGMVASIEAVSMEMGLVAFMAAVLVVDTAVVSEEVMPEDIVTMAMVMVWEWVLDSPITGLTLPILTILTHPIILHRPL